jgi:threonine/homoserine/homoserine lactone efflux protein
MIMDMDVFLKGMMIGLLIAVPLGPIGILCIRRTLVSGMASGLASGLGAALADSLYGVIAAFGLAAVAAFMAKYTVALRLAGGAFLFLLGLKAIFRGGREEEEIPAPLRETHDLGDLVGDFFSTLFLTLSNPVTIIVFMAIFAGMDFVAEFEADHARPFMLVAGVFSGSFLWWCVLSFGIGKLRHRLDKKIMRLLNLVSGAVLVGFALLVIGGTLLKGVG